MVYVKAELQGVSKLLIYALLQLLELQRSNS